MFGNNAFTFDFFTSMPLLDRETVFLILVSSWKQASYYLLFHVKIYLTFKYTAVLAEQINQCCLFFSFPAESRCECIPTEICQWDTPLWRNGKEA